MCGAAGGLRRRYGVRASGSVGREPGKADAVAVTDATRHRCGGPSRMVPARRAARHSGHGGPNACSAMRARARVSPTAVDKLPTTGFAERELETVSPPGAIRSKPQTPRAGRRGDRFSAVTYCLCTFTFRAQGRGELALPGVPRALDFLRVQKRRNTGVPGASAKNTGDDACLHTSSLPDLIRQSIRPRGLWKLSMNPRVNAMCSGRQSRTECRG